MAVYWLLFILPALAMRRALRARLTALPATTVNHLLGTRLLCQVLHRHIPQALMDRPKTGYGIPL